MADWKDVEGDLMVKDYSYLLNYCDHQDISA